MFQRTIQLAQENERDAYYYYAKAEDAYAHNEHYFAENYERMAERHALLAAEYYVEAECHNWSKRG